MKKLTLSIFTFFIVLSAIASGGENPKTLKQAPKHNVSTQATTQNAPASPNFPGSLVFDLGFNFLNDEPEDMKLNFFGSKIFNVYYMYEIRLGNSAFSFNPGLGLGLEKCRFDKNVTLATNNEGTAIVPLSEDWDVKRSKLAANYVDIPIELRFHANKDNFRKSFKVGIGAKAGILFNSHSKIRYKEDGDNKTLKSKEPFNLNRFRYGVQGRIGIGSFSVFYYQELSSLFKDGKGPEGTDASPFKVGISLYAF